MTSWKAVKVKIPEDLNTFKRILVDEFKTDPVVEKPKKDFESFVETFRESPEIEVETKEKSNEITQFTGVTSNWQTGKKAKPEDKVMFLMRGTKVRYATMASNFRAKTKKGLIASGSGGGQRNPLYVDTSKPRDGIESRDTEATVKEKREKGVQKEMQDRLNKAVKKAGVKRL